MDDFRKAFALRSRDLNAHTVGEIRESMKPTKLDPALLPLAFAHFITLLLDGKYTLSHRHQEARWDRR